jgi:hypothetical protein
MIEGISTFLICAFISSLLLIFYHTLAKQDNETK